MSKAKTITTTTITVVVLFAAVLLTKVEPSPTPVKAAPSPGPDCNDNLADLADCLSYVEVGSNMTKPDSPCCPEISNSINTSPVCLCKLIADPASLGLSDIDTSRALMLPSVCNTLKGSPVGLCEAIGVTFPSPPASPKAPPSKAIPTLASAQHFLTGLALVFFTYFL